jgi:hypothetical protein
MAQNPLGGPPPVVDVLQRGRALAWILSVGVFVVTLVVLAVALSGSILVGVLALSAAYAVGAWRAVQVRSRVRAVLTTPSPGAVLALRVALIQPGFHPIWSRGHGVLSIGNGRVQLWPTGLDLPVSQVRIGLGGQFTNAGLRLDTAAGPGPRLSLVSSWDPATYWAALLVDRVLVDDLRRILDDLSQRAAADLPTAGWYADPAGGPQARWWDGKGWTAHLQ